MVYMQKLFDTYASGLLSDVVIKSSHGYRNMSTGASSRKLGDVLSGRRFICVRGYGVLGYCCVRDGKNSLLIFSLCLKKDGWEVTEYCRVVRGCDGTLFRASSSYSFYIGTVFEDAFGQYCIPADKNLPGLSLSEQSCFIGGIATTDYIPKYGVSHVSSLLVALHQQEHDILEDRNRIGMIDDSMIGVMEHDDSFEEAANEFFMASFKPSAYMLSIVEERRFCTIGMKDGRVYFRFYICPVTADEKGNPCCAGFIEYLRMFIDDIYENFFASNLNFPVIYGEGNVKDVLPWIPEYGELLSTFVFTIKEPLLESLYKSHKHIWNGFLNYVKFSCLCDATKEAFGEVYDRKCLHQKLGIPKHVLDTCYFGDIVNMKKLFRSWPDYLQNMNAESCDRILCSTAGISQEGLEAVGILIEIYGPVCHMDYLKYMSTLSYPMQYKICEVYKKMRSLSAEARKYFTWKVDSDREIQEQLSMVSMMASSNIDFDRFGKQQDETERKMSYQSGRFCIIVPKSPFDIFNEGEKLHHCLKSFIVPVASGETVILFIRKNDEPEKNYFTLEVRNGGIRQCHGLMNASIRNSEDYEELKTFLKGFCNEKNLEYSEGSGRLGA